MTISHFSSPELSASTIFNEEFPHAVQRKHHPEYYFEDGNLVIMVCEILYLLIQIWPLKFA